VEKKFQQKLVKAGILVIKKKEILNMLRECIVNLNIEEIKQTCQDALAVGIPPVKAITEGMAEGMNIVGERYEAGEYFLSELIVAGEVMKEGMKVLEPHLKKAEIKKLGKVVLATVKGDIHDIGKNIVATLLDAAGFEVIDLGVDVSAQQFLDKVREVGADVLGLSALLTTTLLYQETVIHNLQEAGLRDQVKVIVGGVPAGPEWAEEIGADAYAENATEAVAVVKQLVGA